MAFAQILLFQVSSPDSVMKLFGFYPPQYSDWTVKLSFFFAEKELEP